MSQMRWGLPPTWTSNSSGSYKIINARSEDVLARPAFRESLHSRRCLIPADGFYEWKHEGKEKLPFCFTLADDSIFAFAGIWESSKNLQGLESCAILTTTSNELMRGVHNRMPVILPREAYEIWLDPYFKNPRGLQPLLKPLSPDLMRRYRVSQRVNQVKNDDSECAMKI
jgi:putative SOS response-associated peptidase YedK